jgi:hypothetical protein
MVWCFVRLFMPSPAGRKRFNVLEAINAVTKEALTVTNETQAQYFSNKRVGFNIK